LGKLEQPEKRSMLYVGHFSFGRLDDASLARQFDHGYFTYMVEADSPKEAINKFESLIRSQS
jgi:hypothetical protein